MSDAIAAHLVVDDPERAAQWYASVFGARETDRIPLPDGTVFAIDLTLGATTIALAGEYPDQGSSPEDARWHVPGPGRGDRQRG